MTTGFETILFDKEGGIATVTLNRPDQINAYNIQMRDDLWSVFSAIEIDREVRCVVIRGAGKRGFCAGADLTEFGTAPSVEIARVVRWERDVFGLLLRLPAPTVAVLHGHVIGSGLEIALLCDMRIASRDIRFAMPETSLGLIPAATGTQTLPRHWRRGRALELLLTGRTVRAGEALAAGLVHRLVERENLVPYTDDLAHSLAQLPCDAAIGVRRAVFAALDQPLTDGLATEAEIAKKLAARTAARTDTRIDKGSQT
jgi:enoyl-CoA hydratase/carnithine racemase